MPGHDTSSFVSRDCGIAEVIDGRNFCAAERFQGLPGDLRPNSGRAVPLPDITRTKIQSPRITTPVRRLTVNRKPLRTHGSLAQPPISGNGLYSMAGHLVESDRLPLNRRVYRQNSRGMPCLNAAIAC